MTGNDTAALAQAALFMQMCAMASMMSAVAQQGRPYVATEESAAKTRSSLYAAGMTNVPGPRSTKTRKPTAAERCKAEAAKWGF